MEDIWTIHGTGTQVGDPIETNTIGKFFGRSPYESPLLIGSVKNVLAFFYRSRIFGWCPV